jgi:hypothetical protein
MTNGAAFWVEQIAVANDYIGIFTYFEAACYFFDA